MDWSLQPLDDVVVAACAVDASQRISLWNRAAVDLFGVSAGSVIGLDWHGVIPTLEAPACCALCQTRAALQSGDVAGPVQVTIAARGRGLEVVMVPVSVSRESMGFVMLQLKGASSQPGARQPIPIQSRVRQLGDDRLVAQLSNREREILSCVSRGLDARGIARQLGISHATARNYVQRVLTKLGAHNKAEAVSVALTYDLLAS